MASECGSGFLTLNQSILIIIISGVLSILCVIAVIIVSVQYSKVITLVRRTIRPGKSDKRKDKNKSVSWSNQSALNTSSPQWPEQTMSPYDDYRRSSSIPRALLDPLSNPYMSHTAGTYPMRQPQKPTSNENLYRPRDKSLLNDTIYRSRDATMANERSQQERGKQRPKEQKGMMVIRRAAQPGDGQDDAATMANGNAQKDRQRSQMEGMPYNNRGMGQNGGISDNFILQAPKSISY